MRFVHITHVLVLTVATAATSVRAAEPTMSYAGRIVSDAGKPMSGTFDVEARFFDKDGIQLGTTVLVPEVLFSEGMFQIPITLNGAELNTIFGDYSTPVFIEVSTDGKAYPRQRFMATPYALRVPIDNKTLRYDDDGKLAVGPAVAPGANQFLTKDGSGAFVWATPEPRSVTADPTGLVAADEGKVWFNSTTNQLKYWDGSAAIALGAGGGGGIANLSGETGASQTLVIGSTGNTPGWTHAGGVHTLNIPMANAGAGVTAGLISNVELSSIGAKVAKSGDAMTGDLSLSGNKVTNLGTPVAAADATPKGYVDTALAGKQASLGYTPLNKAGDTMGAALGLASLASDPAGLVVADKGKVWFNSTSGEVKYWNGSAAIALGAAGSGLGNLSGETGSTQTLSLGSAGTAPAWTHASNDHKLDIPMASAAGVTAGLLSKVDYDAFNGKQTALGYTPLRKDGDTFAGHMAAAGYNITGLGNVELGANKTLQVGAYAADPVGFGALDAGRVWWNSTSGQVKYWDGGAARVVGTNTVTSTEIANGTIVDADINASAAIATSKLSGAVTSISGHGLGGLATLSAVGSTEITNGTIVDADVNASAAIATSKLSGAVTSIPGHGLGGLATLSAVGSTEITNGAIVDADVNASAAIATSKLSGAVTSISGHGLGSLATLSAVGSTEITNGAIVDADVSASAAIATSKLSGAVTSISGHGLGGLATLSAVGSTEITNGAIVDADISASAAIDPAKINGGTGITNTEFGYLDGVTSSIQTQLDSKVSSAHTHASLSGPGGSPANVLNIDGSGNTGIGTTSPAYKLDVRSSSGGIDLGAVHTYTSATTGTNNITGVYGYASDALANTVTNNGYIQGVWGSARLTGQGTVQSAYGVSGLAGTSTGGTGTVTSAYALWGQVVNSGSGTITNGYGLYLGDSEATNGYGVYQNSANDMNFFSGSVGIGTQSPAHKLQVDNATTGEYAILARSNVTTAANATNYDVGTGSYARKTVNSAVSDSGYAMGSHAEGYLLGAGSVAATYGGRFDAGLYTGSTGTSTEAFAIRARVLNQGSGSIPTGYGLYVDDVQATTGYGIYQAGANDRNYFGGKIGIGSLNPGYELDVAGTIRATNLISTSGLDLSNAALTNASALGIGTTSPTATLQAKYSNTATSGSIKGVEITPTYNQASGTAANTDLLINRTETAIGSGTQRLLDAQVGGTSKFSVSNAGDGYFAGNVAIGTTTSANKVEVRGVALNQYALSAGTDSVGRGVEIVSQDYVAGSAGSALSLNLGAGSGTTYAYLSAASSGKSVPGILALNPSGGNVGIGTSVPNQTLAVTGNQTTSGYLAVGSNSNPANTTAGDLSAKRLFVSGAAAGSFASLDGTLTTTANTAVYGTGLTTTLSPASDSQAQFRSQLIGTNLNTSSNFTSPGLISAAWVENRVVNSGTIHDVAGVRSIGLVLGSTASTIGTTTNAAGGVFQPVSSFTNSVTGTVTNARGITVADSAKNLLTITNQAGIYIEPLSAATNNTSLLISQTAVPSGNYGIYNASTNQNYFAGSLGIGSTTPSSMVDVVKDQNTTTQLRVANKIAAGNTSASARITVESGDSSGVIGAFPADYAGYSPFQNRFAIYAPSDSEAGLLVAAVNAGQDVRIRTQAGDSVAVLASGNVGVGTTTASAKLQVSGQIATNIPSTMTPSGTTQTIDWSLGNIQVLSLASATGTVTASFSNGVAGATYAVRVIQGATARNITWPAAVKWPGGTAPTITTAASAVDMVTLFYDGTNYWAAAGQDYK